MIVFHDLKKSCVHNITIYEMKLTSYLIRIWNNFDREYKHKAEESTDSCRQQSSPFSISFLHTCQMVSVSLRKCNWTLSNFLKTFHLKRLLQLKMNCWESQSYTYCPGLRKAVDSGRWWEFALLKRCGVSRASCDVGSE